MTASTRAQAQAQALGGLLAALELWLDVSCPINQAEPVLERAARAVVTLGALRQVDVDVIQAKARHARGGDPATVQSVWQHLADLRDDLVAAAAPPALPEHLRW